MAGGLRARWESPEGRRVAEEVLARLVAGRELGGLGLGEVDGRTDLRGFPAPVPRRLARFEHAGWFIEKLGDLVKLRGAVLRGLDLSGAFLDSFRFWDCVIEDCVLDNARCQDWRLWESQVTGTSLRGANLRRSVLGPWKQGKGNAFSGADFTKADLRDCTWLTAVFTDCDFSAAKLDKVQFLRCGLVRCRFAGVLNEVLFDARVFDPEEREPNHYEDIDMTAAVLRLTEFLAFDLHAVKLPAEPGLRVIEDYPCVQRAATRLLAGREDENSRVLKALLEERGLERGFPLGLFNRSDYVRLRGEELAVLAEAIIKQAEQECGDS